MSVSLHDVQSVPTATKSFDHRHLEKEVSLVWPLSLSRLVLNFADGHTSSQQAALVGTNCSKPVE